jgi:hypothetical protein
VRHAAVHAMTKLQPSILLYHSHAVKRMRCDNEQLIRNAGVCALAQIKQTSSHKADLYRKIRLSKRHGVSRAAIGS